MGQTKGPVACCRWRMCYDSMIFTTNSWVFFLPRLDSITIPSLAPSSMRNLENYTSSNNTAGYIVWNTHLDSLLNDDLSSSSLFGPSDGLAVPLIGRHVIKFYGKLKQERGHEAESWTWRRPDVARQETTVARGASMSITGS
ncbi:hypothetical protein FRC14_007882 [Serendipita sp. 396]|nr:hypothetical protein FRC14_007882 [Serendipita sp. 396]